MKENLVVQIAPYGSWKSPISTDMIVSDAVNLVDIAFDGTDIYWLEGRPKEGGRVVLVRPDASGNGIDLTLAPFNIRTRVHEYGGGAFLINDEVIYFSNFADQRLYRQVEGGVPEVLTPAVALRYADYIYDQHRNRLITVREDHTADGHEPVNTIVSLSLSLSSENGGEVLVSGKDFYACSRLSPDGTKLAWLEWSHPNMPWVGCELRLASVLPDGTLGEAELVAGGLRESIYQPTWSPDGLLYFVSDRTGWWNLYRVKDAQIEPLYPMEAEFGRPMWVFGTQTYGFTPDGNIVCAFTQNGFWNLGILDLQSKILSRVIQPYNYIANLKVSGNRVLMIAGGSNKTTAVVEYNLSSGEMRVHKLASTLEVDSGYISSPYAVEFPTNGGLNAYALYYPPANKDFRVLDGALPPLVVRSHGGPTSASPALLSLSFAYWTSRGFGILDVNYGGSTGYGREYRERLNDNWGVVDVDDCVNGALHLAQQGLVDENRLAIQGGSAGGYTTLCALTFRNTFKAGASYYGVSDLEALARDTHKFESRYLDNLIGAYPERLDLYHARSPIYHTEGLRCPIILFQGLEDKVVPPNQAETMYEAVKQKGIPVAYIPFEGEQHGFRRAENIKRTLEAEFYFYAKVFGFEAADQIEPFEIANL
ncbi:prolyl oligopeptidase family serine peptidase [Candidatus Chlorohelix sp.]|uniref:S9 family peptidase n=1 Tax=Candidatus Chlorohelix sp. TaxID=3139201 RepID=UPI00301EEEA4